MLVEIKGVGGVYHHNLNMTNRQLNILQKDNFVIICFEFH